MAKKKKNKRIYFGMDVQDAIVRYNLSNDNNERNIIRVIIIMWYLIVRQQKKTSTEARNSFEKNS